MAQLKLKKQFEDIGVTLRQSLQNSVKNSKGIDGASYSPPEPSTLALRRRRKSAKGGALKSSGSTKRLWVTGEFGSNAFEYVAYDMGLKVYVKNDAHRNGVPFSDLLRYNSRGQAQVNKNIKNPPLVFPTNKNEIMMMQKGSLPIIEAARKKLQEEVLKQLKAMGELKMKVVLNVG